MNDTLEQFGGSIVHIVLGALILWVGQTTFQHAGILAGVEQKFTAVDERFADSEQSYESLRNWMQNMSGRNREDIAKLFSVADGRRLQGKIDTMTQLATDLERKFTDRLKSLELKLVELETKSQNLEDANSLRWEIAQLRQEVEQTGAAIQSAPVYQPPANVATAQSPYPATTNWQR